MTSPTTFANGLITIQNENWPQGVVVLIAAGIILRVAVWIIPKFERTPETNESAPLKRCQSCGAQIDLIDGEWEHVDDNVMLVVQCHLPHLPEPTQAVER